MSLQTRITRFLTYSHGWYQEASQTKSGLWYEDSHTWRLVAIYGVNKTFCYMAGSTELLKYVCVPGMQVFFFQEVITSVIDWGH